MFDLSPYLNCYVLTLHGWEARLGLFLDRCEELGVRGIKTLYGFDGDNVGAPNWWRGSPRKFACSYAHFMALTTGLSTANNNPIVIFEDDAYLNDNFIESIQEVVAYFRDDPKASLVYLGGRIKRNGAHAVGRVIVRGVRVTGAYGYAMSRQHAEWFAIRILDDPSREVRARRRVPAHRYYNDIKMREAYMRDNHAAVVPPCVGHRGGLSVIEGTLKTPRDLDTSSLQGGVAAAPRCPCEGS